MLLRCKFHPKLIFKQSLDGRNLISHNGPNKQNPNLGNGILGFQLIRNPKARRCLIALGEISCRKVRGRNFKLNVCARMGGG
jgi:hypothetical protein